MKIGIVGLPAVGKSTIFQLLTNVKNLNNGKLPTVGIAQVPDKRIDALSKMFNPKKTTYATIEFTDINSQLNRGSELFSAVRDVDAIVQIVRAFASDTIPLPNGNITPYKELTQIQEELILADWSLLEGRLERLAKQRTKGDAAELAVLKKCQETLEQDSPLRGLVLSEQEDKLIRGYDFLTRKPLMLVINVDENQMIEGKYPEIEKVEQWANEHNVSFVGMSGQVEMEINQLDDADKIAFMQDLGIEESGIARLARAAYSHLGLISYFTVGEDEVRAWTIQRGTSAREGAGKIHSDIERGFIRAEVASYPDLMTYGSMAKLKEKGLFRLEGKDYMIKDGDIISFRFNV